MPGRAPRKALPPHRSPSFGDPRPGIIFQLPFGWPRSLGTQSSQTSCSIPSSHDGEPLPADAIWSANTSMVHCEPYTTLGIRNGDESPKDDTRTLDQFCEGTSSLSLTINSEPSHTSALSLANQFLDTTPVRDDIWRDRCRRKIRQQQKLRESRRNQMKPILQMCHTTGKVPSSQAPNTNLKFVPNVAPPLALVRNPSLQKRPYLVAGQIAVSSLRPDPPPPQRPIFVFGAAAAVPSKISAMQCPLRLPLPRLAGVACPVNAPRRLAGVASMGESFAIAADYGTSPTG